MSEDQTNDRGEADRAGRLKAIIDKLAAGASPDAVKKEFHDLIKGADASEVAALEQSLIEGGMPVEEVQRLCEVHADVFKAGLERGEKAERMPGHPIHTYMAENREARKRARALRVAAFAGNLEAIREAASGLRPIIVHFERKENQLFPYLERTGFSGPSKVMWGKHDEIRAAFKELDSAIGTDYAKVARPKARELAKRVRTMLFMEERILFPNALKRLSDADWAAIRRGDDAIGYAWVEPGAVWDPGLADGRTIEPSVGAYPSFGAAVRDAEARAGGTVPLSVGGLTPDCLDRVLKSLPVDLSFIDADDRVMYYSDSPRRVFPRSPGVIGREVRNCHPPKSVAKVERILEAFKNKEKDEAEFWIEMDGRFIVISYKPIYDGEGNYLGTLETSMDATGIRAMRGQRRLLDW
ncbi:MAG: DUF438 domain-containing protein [Spirochaetes bacterium]|nr:DUF438 domain-containing protein [Spirochaetota bacterium]MBU1079353.1 DUF438 domain-containing protein [Spirochaetota bacterium]